jgi:nicotinamide-nucleotide amidase
VKVRDPAELAQAVAKRAEEFGVTIAVAESLTCGRVVSELGRGEAAADWLRGGVVAYSSEVKREVLGVSPGPVVSARCAEEMAAGVAGVLGADIAVATTGVGGPGGEEGRPAGTVYLGWWCRGRRGSELHRFEGDPTEVVEKTVAAALELLMVTVSSSA